MMEKEGAGDVDELGGVDVVTRGSRPTRSCRLKASHVRGRSFLLLPISRQLPTARRQDWEPGQRRSLLRDVNATFLALQCLHDADRRPPPTSDHTMSTWLRGVGLESHVQQRVLRLAKSWVEVDSAVNEHEALTELLKGRSGSFQPPLPACCSCEQCACWGTCVTHLPSDRPCETRILFLREGRLRRRVVTTRM